MTRSRTTAGSSRRCTSCPTSTITLWTTVYLDHALDQLRADGYPVLDADIARLSPFMRRHINFRGHYSFAPTDLRGARRALRDPDAPDDDG